MGRVTQTEGEKGKGEGGRVTGGQFGRKKHKLRGEKGKGGRERQTG